MHFASQTCVKNIGTQTCGSKVFEKVVAVSFVLSLIALFDKVAGQEKVEFPVSASSKTLGYSPLWVAHRQGFFDQQGLDVQLVLTAKRVDAVPFSSDEANLEGVRL